MSDPIITIYGTVRCKFCKYAVALAEEKGLPYHYVDIDMNPTAKQFLKDEGYVTVPQIYEGSKFIGGYQEFAARVK